MDYRKGVTWKGERGFFENSKGGCLDPLSRAFGFCCRSPPRPTASPGAMTLSRAPPPKSNDDHGGKGKKRKRQSKYLQHSGKKSTIASGVQGFLITCVGGKERQSIKEVISLLDQFSEDPANKDGSINGGEQPTDAEAGDCSQAKKPSEVRVDSEIGPPDTEASELLSSETSEDSDDESLGWVKCRRVGESSNAKRPCEGREDEGPHEQNSMPEAQLSEDSKNDASKGFDELLAAELEELRDPRKARFTGYETGCNGVIFVRMHPQDERQQKGPKELAEAIVRDAAASKKSRSRFCMRLLPVELTCYASPSELKKVAEPLISRHFPADSDQPSLKFAVICECRANTNLNKMEFVHAMAKMVPEPHKVDLKNPDKTILIQIVKTACAVGVVQQFKELAKYNLKQLTSPSSESNPKGKAD